MRRSEAWVTLYGPLGSWRGPLADVPRDVLEDMLLGNRDYKLQSADEVKQEREAERRRA